MRGRFEGSFPRRPRSLIAMYFCATILAKLRAREVQQIKGLAERVGFSLAISAISMKPKTQMHSSQCLCRFQAVLTHSLAYASVSPVNTKIGKKGITRYHWKLWNAFPHRLCSKKQLWNLWQFGIEPRIKTTNSPMACDLEEQAAFISP